MIRIRWFYGFFLVSGFCSLVYEVVWIRLAMATFGATTPAVSTVLSVFMAGLAVGSVGGGRLAARLAHRGPSLPLRLYASAELGISISALAVPRLFLWGRLLLLGVDRGADWRSAAYYLVSGSWVALALLPFCVCMGATFPLAMSAIRRAAGSAPERSFSYLYVANVMGATAGTLASAFVLIELFGFRGTLATAAILNLALAATALALSLGRREEGKEEKRKAPPERPAPVGASPWPLLLMLFCTGMVSMAMEVVWTRQFTPYLGTFVYAFACILAVYLAATFVGSGLYRRWAASSRGARRFAALGLHAWPLAGAAGLMPLLAADPRLPLVDKPFPGTVRVGIGLVLFCGAVGFLTPMLVDRCSGGDPDRAGRAYAVNVLGCIAGPLLAGFVLLPHIGERTSLILLALPLFALWPLARGRIAPGEPGPRRGLAVLVPCAAVALVLGGATKDFETVYPARQVLRDYEATVIATGEGMKKQLLVNGYGMSALTPVTKMMVHFPAAFRSSPPRNALVICFGMGTSFRSALSWNIPVTAVELVPSVPALFGYYHADGPDLLRSPNARVVIDDGRRFLERTSELYDLVAIDPPPPAEAAGSSLLYSEEFYRLIRRHLAPGGVLQQWFYKGDEATVSSVVRALLASFPNVRAFPSVAGYGMHFLCTEEPLPPADALTLASRLPPTATRDLMEWWPGIDPRAPFAQVLTRELSLDSVVSKGPRVPALSDDHPVNEYFFLRRTFGAGG